MKTEDFLQPYQLLHGRWSVRKKIGSGTFGQVYAAVDIETRQSVSLKVESTEPVTPTLIKDVAFLKELQGLDHVCQFFGDGITVRFRYLVMTFQGKNLAALRSAGPLGGFSLCTTLLLGRQMLRAVESLHAAGIVHRDIKPSNFVMGRGDNRRTVYIIDFGLSRRYLTPSGVLLPARESVSFVGTTTYASVNVHRGKEAGRHDDLWSLLYTLVELLVGRLPWEGMRNRDFVLAMKEIAQINKNVPVELKSFLEHLLTLDYNTAPNYHFLSLLFENCMGFNDICDSDPYDWETTHGDTSVTTTKASPLPGDDGGLGQLAKDILKNGQLAKDILKNGQLAKDILKNGQLAKDILNNSQLAKDILENSQLAEDKEEHRPNNSPDVSSSSSSSDLPPGIFDHGLPTISISPCPQHLPHPLHPQPLCKSVQHSLPGSTWCSLSL